MLRLFLLIVFSLAQSSICFSAVYAGDGFTLFTDDKGVLWALGKNDIGQLGLGRESTYEPVPASTNLRNIKSILRVSGYETDYYIFKEYTRWDLLLLP